MKKAALLIFVALLAGRAKADVVVPGLFMRLASGGYNLQPATVTPNFQFGLYASTAQIGSLTPAAPGNPAITLHYGAGGNGNYFAVGNSFGFAVVPYKVVNGIKLFGASSSQYSIDDNNSGNNLWVTFSWNAVPGVDGYRVFIQDTYYLHSNYDAYYDTTLTQANLGKFGGPPAGAIEDSSSQGTTQTPLFVPLTIDQVGNVNTPGGMFTIGGLSAFLGVSATTASFSSLITGNGAVVYVDTSGNLKTSSGFNWDGSVLTVGGSVLTSGVTSPNNTALTVQGGGTGAGGAAGDLNLIGRNGTGSKGGSVNIWAGNPGGGGNISPGNVSILPGFSNVLNGTVFISTRTKGGVVIGSTDTWLVVGATVTVKSAATFNGSFLVNTTSIVPGFVDASYVFYNPSGAANIRYDGVNYAKMEFKARGGVADSGGWQIYTRNNGSDPAVWHWGALNDAENSESLVEEVTRSGTAIILHEFGGATIQIDGNLNVFGGTGQTVVAASMDSGVTANLGVYGDNLLSQYFGQIYIYDRSAPADGRMWGVQPRYEGVGTDYNVAFTKMDSAGALKTIMNFDVNNNVYIGPIDWSPADANLEVDGTFHVAGQTTLSGLTLMNGGNASASPRSSTSGLIVGDGTVGGQIAWFYSTVSVQPYLGIQEAGGGYGLFGVRGGGNSFFQSSGNLFRIEQNGGGLGFMTVSSMTATTSINSSSATTTNLSVTSATYMSMGPAVNVATTTNNWQFPQGPVVQATATVASTITGFASQAGGYRFTLVNVGTNSITFSQENASSTAANRIWTNTGANTSIPGTATGGGSADFLYDTSKSRWRQLR